MPSFVIFHWTVMLGCSVSLMTRWCHFVGYTNCSKQFRTVPKKTCDHVFDDNLNLNCPFTKIFGTLITNTIGCGQVFLFSHLTYLVQLLYLGKLSRPKYRRYNIPNATLPNVYTIKEIRSRAVPSTRVARAYSSSSSLLELKKSRALFLSSSCSIVLKTNSMQISMPVY